MKIKQVCTCAACRNSTGPMHLHSLCHPSNPFFASIDGDVLTFTCAECKALVAQLRVTELPDAEEDQMGSELSKLPLQ